MPTKLMQTAIQNITLAWNSGKPFVPINVAEGSQPSRKAPFPNLNLVLLPPKLCWEQMHHFFNKWPVEIGLLKQYYWLRSGTATPAHLLCSGRVRKVVVESQDMLYYVSEKPLYIYTQIVWCDVTYVTVWRVTSNTYSTVRTITNMCLHYIWVEVPMTCAHSSDGSCKVHARLQHSPSLCCT